MNKLYAILTGLLLFVTGCTPVPNSIPPGIHITIEAGAEGYAQQYVDRIYSEISTCVAQYVIAPNFNLKFVNKEIPFANHKVFGVTTWNNNSGNVHVEIFKPNGTDWNFGNQTLKHEFVHVVLFYYGVSGGGNIDHLSIKFNECV